VQFRRPAPSSSPEPAGTEAEDKKHTVYGTPRRRLPPPHSARAPIAVQKVRIPSVPYSAVRYPDADISLSLSLSLSSAAPRAAVGRAKEAR